MITLITITVLISIGLYLSFRVTTEIPVLINGLIPSKTGATSKQDSGTTVYIVYTDEDSPNDEKEIYRGYADDKGRVSAQIAAKNIGRPVLVRVRQAGYKEHEYELTVPPHGIIRTVKMETDGVYNGPTRGASIANPNLYYEDSTLYADQMRLQFIRTTSRIEDHPFARVRVEFWLISYIVLIFSFATDYYINSEFFTKGFESFTHAAYFSAVTITTLGYGETHPTHDLWRAACSIEAVLGVFLVGFALNSLFRGPRE
jgi:hypothetical protein|tara:strand:+ start:74227 stop:75000 length:774 start_codon:yes stop_codon:yes gene_type:complete